MPPQRNVIRVAKTVLLILVIPLLGNIFVDGWDWGVGDFVVAGAILFGVGLAIDLAARKITSPALRVFVMGAIALAFLLAWATVVADGETPGYVRAWQTIF